jgi:hypothetical protein
LACLQFFREKIKDFFSVETSIFVAKVIGQKSRAGLPDGFFSNQKSNSGKFYRDLEYFTAIWEIL